VPGRTRDDRMNAESLREVSGKGKEEFAVLVCVCRGGLRAGPPRALAIMKHLIIELSSFYVDICLLSNDVHDYYFVSQGKTTIPNVDDGEECLLTDVRTRQRWRMSQGSRLSFIFVLPLYNDILRRDSLLTSRWFSWINRCLEDHLQQAISNVSGARRHREKRVRRAIEFLEWSFHNDVMSRFTMTTRSTLRRIYFRSTVINFSRVARRSKSNGNLGILMIIEGIVIECKFR